MNVFVVEEYWNNCEEYDLLCDSIEILEICSSLSIAKRVIEDRKKELLKEREKEEYTITECTDEEMHIVYNKMPNSIRCVCYGENFEWSITEREVKES